MDNDDILLLWTRGFNTGFATSTNGITMDSTGEAWGMTPAGTGVKMKKDSKMPVKIFFNLMKKKMGILHDYKYSQRIARLEQAVIEAEKNGQIAFSEELMKKMLVLCREAEMWAVGRKIFLNREHFEQFKNKTARPVSLTALANYARPIPERVLAEKAKCDEAKLFDGYAVMHYDDGKTVKETEKQKQERREKDPILFGIVQYSPRLYFVADWEDEYCDLTLDDLIDRLDLKDEEVTLPKHISLE